MRLLSCSSHRWIDSLFATSAMGKCSLLGSASLRLMRSSVVQRGTLFAVVNARWTTSKQNLLVLEPQWIKSTERAKRLLIPPVYFLRGIRTYDELQIVVTKVGQVKQTVTGHDKKTTETVKNVFIYKHWPWMRWEPGRQRGSALTLKTVMSCSIMASFCAAWPW
jgi:hypothetical protein